jgi:hypothetical protein
MAPGTQADLPACAAARPRTGPPDAPARGDQPGQFSQARIRSRAPPAAAAIWPPLSVTLTLPRSAPLADLKAAACAALGLDPARCTAYDFYCHAKYSTPLDSRPAVTSLAGADLRNGQHVLLEAVEGGGAA